MKAYYCISRRDREFLYVPFVLFSYCSASSTDYSHRWDVGILSKLTFLVKEKKLTQSRLEDLDWYVEEINVPDRIIKRFRNYCSKTKINKRKITTEDRQEMADKVIEWMQRYIEYTDDNQCNVAEDKPYRDSYDGMEDEEDRKDDWWKRGEEYPY